VLPVALLASLAALLPAAVASGAGLPDGRAYELVSPNSASDANVYVQTANNFAKPDLMTTSPFRATPDGDAVVYAGEAEPTGGAGSTGEGAGDEFRATRSTSGWHATDIMAPRQQTHEYEGFNEDLSVGALTMRAYIKPPLTPDAPQNCNVMYVRTTPDEAFHAAFTSTQTPGYCGSPEYAGFSADGSHLIFQSEAVLTPQGESETADNLYESVAGRAYLVSILPSGEAAQDATFGVSSGFPGGVDTETAGADLEHVISSDGLRVVWTDLDTTSTAENPSGTTRLFVREDPESPSAKTVQVDGALGGGGQYRGANSDDSLIYFTKEEKLYQYDLQSGATTDLTPAGGVVGVAGISKDGQLLYPVAKTVLAANANSQGESAVPGNCTAALTGFSLAEEEEAEAEAAGVLPAGRACNLYVMRVGGAPRFIATLLPADDRAHVGPNGGYDKYGDWVGNLALRSAEVSAADGHVLAFMSKRSLTRYDNNTLREIFVYDSSDEQLACATCNPSGEPALRGHVYGQGEETGENYEPIAFPVIPLGTPYQYRWVSANGNRVFFDSTEALVPQDTNGLQDVYEWERAGEGSCQLASGCLYLLSGDTASTEADFADASESGDDVFFESRADLAPEDEGENVVLYDARVGGGFAHPSQACTGTGCQGVPPTIPVFATPPSATFNGVGNYPSGSTVPGVKPKSATPGAQRLARALNACRVKRVKRRRATCERQARKRFGGAESKTSTASKERRIER
jgi:hypothetical protein